MKRLCLCASVLAVFAVAGNATAGAELDPAVNGLRLSRDAVKTFDFETGASLVGAQRASWDKSASSPLLTRTPIAAATSTGGIELRTPSGDQSRTPAG